MYNSAGDALSFNDVIAVKHHDPSAQQEVNSDLSSLVVLKLTADGTNFEGFQIILFSNSH